MREAPRPSVRVAPTVTEKAELFPHWRSPGYRGAQAKRRKYLEAILAALPIIPYTEQTAYEHARIWAQLESSGKMIGSYNVIVAATALVRGSSLATFDERHFAQVKGLTILELK